VRTLAEQKWGEMIGKMLGMQGPRRCCMRRMRNPSLHVTLHDNLRRKYKGDEDPLRQLHREEDAPLGCKKKIGSSQIAG
jgi:hypothetical protein